MKTASRVLQVYSARRLPSVKTVLEEHTPHQQEGQHAMIVTPANTLLKGVQLVQIVQKIQRHHINPGSVVPKIPG